MYVWCVITANLFGAIREINSVANAKCYDCFIDTTGPSLRTCVRHDGEEIDLGMKPGDIYSSSGSATK